MSKLGGRIMVWAALAIWFAAVISTSTSTKADEFGVAAESSSAGQLYTERAD
ncbi:MAG: hypothetical protein V3S70_03950 [Gammaproteobacteria bacterium]